MKVRDLMSPPELIQPRTGMTSVIGPKRPKALICFTWRQEGGPKKLFLEVAKVKYFSKDGDESMADKAVQNAPFAKISEKRTLKKGIKVSGESEFSAVIELDGPGKYIWRVRAMDEEDFHGRKGRVRYFTIKWRDDVPRLRIRDKSWKK